jgi:hypothetical protein
MVKHPRLFDKLGESRGQILGGRDFSITFFELIFFTGFQHILKTLHRKNDWLTTLMYNTVCIFLVVNFVAYSLEAGGVFNPAGAAIDATQEGVLAQGNYLMYGSIGRLLAAVFMTISGILTFKTKNTPGMDRMACGNNRNSKCTVCPQYVFWNQCRRVLQCHRLGKFGPGSKHSYLVDFNCGHNITAERGEI